MNYQHMLEQMGAEYFCEVLRTPIFEEGGGRIPKMVQQGDGTVKQEHTETHQCTIRRRTPHDNPGAFSRALFVGRGDNEEAAIEDAFRKAEESGIEVGPASEEDRLREQLAQMQAQIDALTAKSEKPDAAASKGTGKRTTKSGAEPAGPS